MPRYFLAPGAGDLNILEVDEAYKMNLTRNQIDALTGLINMSVGRSARMLDEMVNTRVYLQAPPIKVFSPLEAKKELERVGRNQLAAVQLLFKGPFSGTAALVFRHETASKLVSIFTGEGLGTYDPDSGLAFLARD